MGNQTSKLVDDVGPCKIKFHGVLGRGSFGEVFHSIQVETHEDTVAKRLISPKNFNWKSNDVHNAKREFEIIKSIGIHKNIDKVYDTIDLVEGNEFWIISEYCDLGDLNEYMKIYDVNESHKIQMMGHIASGLAFLHGMDPIAIIHKDLKPSNTMLTLQDGKHVLKICDIGLLQIFSNISDLSLSQVVGTQDYKAPEQFNKSNAYHSEKIDVFAAGIMLHRMMQAEPGKSLEADDSAEPIGLTMWKTK